MVTRTRISASEIIEKVSHLCRDANFNLNVDVLDALRDSYEAEGSPVAKEVFAELLENAKIARECQMPICQDTGVAVVFVEAGEHVEIAGGHLYQAIHEGVRQGYEKGFLRKSMVADPFSRVNTGNNTPAIIHTELVPGDRLKITFMAKGGGCENMSRIAMLTPADGRTGVINFVVETVKIARANPCPPIIVGVGIGGTFDYAAMLAKKSLLRPLGTRPSDPDTAALEQEMLERINDSGIGAQGLGGWITALAVHVERYPCHIASLPVAVNIECHAHRVKTVVLGA
ncbi:MAG: fumarate hydratase [Candidatus Brocadia sp. AMX2]|uniref:Fumarate hydratase subunit alpha n=1 Tax=Candidatus Brocadia sinica JPN1 TaxID=1197129 RepID=A0ABQ0JUB3_9BACT|nr:MULTISPECIES: fumarate hydratase [Brocadia]KXK29852.1 MAG: fumarate hydratase alpha subunit [Candidatus Brocadia sinica]MBC6933001.1 fumarate hydratase [Candidatus Brocadia sp.]MBL1169307.1 fumarate hydratase [Candidatus Brocadia sp. AMX1]NOG41810.1 fumarate hydratase [Planctomycetota bacterium]KAA0241945.1 MAG: fumarate hydratase [Candidatus Brocadia sp. AMX2]